MEAKKRVYNKPTVIQYLPDTAQCRRLLDMLDIKDKQDKPTSENEEENSKATE